MARLTSVLRPPAPEPIRQAIGQIALTAQTPSESAAIARLGLPADAFWPDPHRGPISTKPLVDNWRMPSRTGVREAPKWRGSCLLVQGRAGRQGAGGDLIGQRLADPRGQKGAFAASIVRGDHAHWIAHMYARSHFLN